MPACLNQTSTGSCHCSARAPCWDSASPPTAARTPSPGSSGSSRSSRGADSSRPSRSRTPSSPVSSWTARFEVTETSMRIWRREARSGAPCRSARVCASSWRSPPQPRRSSGPAVWASTSVHPIAPLARFSTSGTTIRCSAPSPIAARSLPRTSPRSMPSAPGHDRCEPACPRRRRRHGGGVHAPRAPTIPRLADRHLAVRRPGGGARDLRGGEAQLRFRCPGDAGRVHGRRDRGAGDVAVGGSQPAVRSFSSHSSVSVAERVMPSASTWS